MKWQMIVGLASISIAMGCADQSPISATATDHVATENAASESSVGPVGLDDAVLTAAVGPMESGQSLGGDNADSGASRAVVEELAHDFGTLELNEVGEHRFAIRNDGDAPLKLQPIASSCKCITLEIEQPVIAPGEEGHVAVYWKSGEVKPQFAQATSIKTNDPAMPEIQLKVRGSYLPVVAAEPPELFLPRVEPDTAATAQALIVSQQLDAFQIESLVCTLEGAQWDLQAAQPADLSRLDAKAGWRLTVRLPTDLPEGPFQHLVSFDVVRPRIGNDDEHDPPIRLEMPIVGKVLRRLTVHGKDIDPSGALRLGTVITGERHQRQYLVKVRDPELNLQVESIETVPASVQVALQPYGDGSKPGIYSLQVEVPADAPHGVYRDQDAGEIVIRFDHPRIHELRLAVDLIVAPPKGRSR